MNIEYRDADNVNVGVQSMLSYKLAAMLWLVFPNYFLYFLRLSSGFTAVLITAVVIFHGYYQHNSYHLQQLQLIKHHKYHDNTMMPHTITTISLRLSNALT